MRGAAAVLKIPHITRSVSSRGGGHAGICQGTFCSFGDEKTSSGSQLLSEVFFFFLFPPSAVYGNVNRRAVESV